MEQIFEGSSDKDPKVSKYCGKTIPPSYTSLGNALLVVFKSDFSVNLEGFRISYEIGKNSRSSFNDMHMIYDGIPFTVCGGLFENETGVITSPLYPNPYEHSRSCMYEILAPPGKAITLHFDDFDIEDTSYPECYYDFVQIYDGYQKDATDSRKYCGATIPPNAISTTNVMILHFQSDVSISGKGFKATYSSIDVKCGGVIKKLGHDIQPPKELNSQNYENNAECIWVIMAPPGFVVQLTFSTFHLEYSSACSMDYVAVYEGFAYNGSIMNSFCGTNVPPVTQSNSNVLSIKFVSDWSLPGEGFTVQYTFIESRRGLLVSFCRIDRRCSFFLISF